MEWMEALKGILNAGSAASQDDIVKSLRKNGHDVTQSTVSRALRRLGAIKGTDDAGRAVYRLYEEAPLPAPVSRSIMDLISEITHNDTMIVIHTSPGTASLVAKHLDHHQPAGILGTIAGEDTIFVAPPAKMAIPKVVAAIRSSLIG
jgi:transcriptional regulator of arginine metabolism